MSLNSTMSIDRIHIGFFGMMNVGKSSLINKIANQEVSIVSDIKGTTTDPVKKTMEILPLGPVLLIDTPGFDDESILGMERIKRTKKVLSTCDIAILVTNQIKLSSKEEELLAIIKERDIPYLILHNKMDLLDNIPNNFSNELFVSAKSNIGILDIKNAIGNIKLHSLKEINYVRDFIKMGDIVVLVTPIDESAPKGRLIVPEVQAIRDILDGYGIAITTQVENLSDTLKNLKNPPRLVITDSQAFKQVMKLVPDSIPLTSFSILMARYKGFLDTAVLGAKSIHNLKNHSNILICEGCTHHRKCEDIGTVKLPLWIRNFTNLELNFEFTSGGEFPHDLSKYDLIIHCGGCMLQDNEVKNRMNQAKDANIPFTNYGILIAYMNGILERSISILKK